MDTVGPSKKGALLINNLVADEKMGVVSAFTRYDPDKEPDPKYFKEIWRTASHKRKYVNIARISSSCSPSTMKCHKDKVPCRYKQWQNEPFHPIFEIVHHTNIATITKQRVFKSPGSKEKRLGMAAKDIRWSSSFGLQCKPGHARHQLQRTS